MRVQAHGLDADLPAGWEARIFRRDARQARASGRTDAPDPNTNPILHAANFALPEDRGDFGSGAVDRMRSSHVFVSLVEFDAEAAGTPLFAASRPPWPVDPNAFSPSRLQRHIPGQGGCQFFFSDGGRAFCLYVVLGSHLDRRSLVAQRVNPALERVRIERRDRVGAERDAAGARP